MPYISIELNNRVTANIHYYYARPYDLDFYNQGSAKYRICYANGSTDSFASIDEVIEAFNSIIESGPVIAKARASGYTFLQRSYKKKAFELTSGEMRMIQDAVADIPPLSFSSARELLDFCLPDPVF